jgi:hypothetical protein
VGLAVGALGIGGLAEWLGGLTVGPLALDANQLGLLAGGGLILLGALAARLIMARAG